MKIITLLILVFTQFIVFSQGPVDGYNKGKGKLEVGLGFSNEEGDKFYAGRTLINSSRNIKSYTFFSIYGITNKLDVQLNLWCEFWGVFHGVNFLFSTIKIHMNAHNGHLTG